MTPRSGRPRASNRQSERTMMPPAASRGRNDVVRSTRRVAAEQTVLPCRFRFDGTPLDERSQACESVVRSWSLLRRISRDRRVERATSRGSQVGRVIRPRDDLRAAGRTVPAPWAFDMSLPWEAEDWPPGIAVNLHVWAPTWHQVGAGSEKNLLSGLMRMRGLEPPRGCPHTALNRARLPIPPHPRG